MGRIFRIGDARGGWKSDDDVFGQHLMICGRAVTVGKNGPDAHTIHLTPLDRVQAAEALLHGLGRVAEPLPRRSAGTLAWGVLVAVAVLLGVLVGASL